MPSGYSALSATNLQNHKKRLIILCTWQHQAICKNWKRIGGSDTNNKNIQPRYRNGIWHRKMCHAYNENWIKRNNRMNRNAKSGKNQNIWKKGKLQVLGNIRNGHHQTSRDERKNRKSSSDEQEKFWKPRFAIEISSKR